MSEDRERRAESGSWAAIFTLFLAGWMFFGIMLLARVTGFALPGRAMWNNAVTGGLMALAAVWCLNSSAATPYWLLFYLGMWSLLSPIFLVVPDFNIGVNNMIVGFTVAALSIGPACAKAGLFTRRRRT